MRYHFDIQVQVTVILTRAEELHKRKGTEGVTLFTSIIEVHTRRS